MVDEPAQKKSNTSRNTFIVIAAILLVCVVAFFVSKVGLDKALVRQQVDAFAQRLSERGKLEGRDLRFSYDGIEVTSGFADKHAVLKNPRLVIRPLNPPKDEDKNKPHSLLISAPQLNLYPESADLSSMRIELPQQINVATEENPTASLLKIASSTPFAITVEQLMKGDDHYTSVHYVSPPEITLTYLQEHKGEGAEEATPTVVPVYQDLNITMDKGEGDLTIQQGGNNLGEGALDLQNIALTPAAQPEGAIKIKQITSKWSNALNANNVNVVNSTFMIDEVTAPAQVLPYAPMSMAIDFTYQGAMPNTPEEIASIRAQESAFKLRTFMIKTKDAEVGATADFKANAEDMLPVGVANLTITNLPFIMTELKKNSVLNDSGELLAASILQQVTGLPYAELKDVNVDVQRERGGAFKIGKSTFEELFAILLKNKFSTLPIAPSAPPAAGAAPAPAPKPIPVPIDGSRG